MKLSHRIIAYITIVLIALFAIWTFVFYQTSHRRIYQHIDSVLVQQSDRIITRFLDNDSLPNSLSGNSGTIEFFIEKVSPEYAKTHQEPVFQDVEEYIDDLQDEEIVRQLTRPFQKQGVDYELTVSTQVFAWNDTLDFAVVSIISLAGLLLIAIILIVSLIIITNMKPVYRLTEWLRHRNEGDAIPEPDNRIKTQEFKDIEAAVLESTQRSQRLIEEQKRFIGNASHEMQTPIAVCRNRLELLVDNTELDENQLTEIGKTLNTLNELSKLNRSLLMLTKIENHQYKEEADIDINQTVRQAMENLEDIFEGQHIRAEVLEDESITVTMDPILAKSLVTNLLKNAFVHNHSDGVISVRLKDNCMSVANTGNGTPLDAEAIFQPFHKQGDNSNSTGLGLAIVKAICNEYDFGLEYQFVENQHVFKIFFK